MQIFKLDNFGWLTKTYLLISNVNDLHYSYITDTSGLPGVTNTTEVFTRLGHQLQQIIDRSVLEGQYNRS